MRIKLVGSETEIAPLDSAVRSALSELALADFVTVETTDDAAYKSELGISAAPALCIEEEAIDFRDMIFEGSVPSSEELKSMFVSIFGGAADGSCDSGGCGGGCSGCSH